MHLGFFLPNVERGGEGRGKGERRGGEGRGEGGGSCKVYLEFRIIFLFPSPWWQVGIIISSYLSIPRIFL